MSRERFWAPSGLQLGLAESGLGRALRRASPPLLFGLRLWAAVCLAFYIAFWLELDNAYWAATSAAIVCQPSLGASLRKGWFRLVGTVVGAVVIVALTAAFPQQRIGFLLGLALWCAACGLVATLLRNFAAYSAALAGYTAAIIASDELGAVGGANGGQVFMLAVTRASEIWIGIVCAGVVLAGTDFGGARRRLAAQLAAITADITGKFADTLQLVGPAQSQTRALRRDFLRRVIALDPAIDEAQGEVADLRYHSPVLQGAMRGLFAALSSWQMAALHLELMPRDQGRFETEAVRRNLPQSLGPTLRRGEAPHLRAGLRGGGARAHRSAGSRTVATNAGRPGGGDARRNLAGPGRARPAHRRARGICSPRGGRPDSRTRLGTTPHECAARLRDSWAGRAFLDRDGVAERRAGHRLRRHHRHPVLPAGRPGLRHGPELHGRDDR